MTGRVPQGGESRKFDESSNKGQMRTTQTNGASLNRLFLEGARHAAAVTISAAPAMADGVSAILTFAIVRFYPDCSYGNACPPSVINI